MQKFLAIFGGILVVLILGFVIWRQVFTDIIAEQPDVVLDDTWEYIDDIDDGDDMMIAGPVVNLSIVDGAEIQSPFTLTGEARGWFFEGSFPVLLKDEAGNILAETLATANGDWMVEDYVAFTAVFSFDVTTTTMGQLILKKDNPSGLPENDDEMQLSVTLLPGFATLLPGSASEKRFTDVYFMNHHDDPALLYCDEPTPTTREVVNDDNYIRATLEQLLVGPDFAEKAYGFETAIPTGGHVVSFEIKDKIAYVDFDDVVEPDGGSCAVTAVRAQIEETLKQFDTIDSVIISINGKTEGIFQP